MKIKMKKIFAGLGIFLVVLIALGLVVRAVFNYTTGKKLHQELQSLRSKGYPISLRDLEPTCADSENAALSWKAAEAFLTVKKEDRTALYDSINTVFFKKKLDSEERGRIIDIIKTKQKVIQLLKEASEKSCFKYQESYDVSAAKFIIPKAVELVLAFRILALDTLIKAENGQVEEAVEECLAGIRFLRTYLQEPLLINYLVALANMKQLTVCLQPIITQNEIDDELLREVMKELDLTPWRNGLAWTFKSERVIGLDIATRILDGDISDISNSFKEKLYYWIFRPVLKLEIVWMIKSWEEIFEMARHPYFELGDIKKKMESRVKYIPKSYKTARMLFPNVITVMFKEATLEAMFHTARVGIACKLYKNKYGVYPEDPGQLVPEFLSQVPLDPFTGSPLIYRKQEGGIIIYSLGSNRKDDGGRGTWRIPSLVMEKDDDWAWSEGY